MPSERDKMLAGELYDPLDAELVAGRDRARDLCQALNATREAQQEERRRIVKELFGAGGESVWKFDRLEPKLSQYSRLIMPLGISSGMIRPKSCNNNS